MKREVQARRVFKYYRLPKWKLVEYWENVTTVREIVKKRDSPVVR